METIAELIAAAGSRADNLNGFAKELFTSLETRVAALEEKVESLAALNNPVARASASASSTTDVASAVSAKLSKVAKAAKAAATTLDEALADEVTETQPATTAAPAPAVASPAPAAEPAPTS